MSALLDISRELPKIIKLTQNKKINKRNLLSNKEDYNCWGFVAFAFNWNSELEWLEEYEMDFYLKNNTRPITKEKARTGDVIVFRHKRDLIHTAILTNKEKKILLHKPGSTSFEADTIKGALDVYYGCRVTFRRPYKKKRTN